ncbi:MAG: energy transducer TonB [Bacteroidales bacterium]|nr:energy transducer TonB [Bacteroidales bacterium]
MKKEDRAGIYTTVIIHLAVLILLLATSLGFSLQKENSFVLDFSKLEELERLEAEVERLRQEAEFQQAISQRLERELGAAGARVRNVAVDRAALKDDRNTDADQLYKDAERLARELQGGFEVPDDGYSANLPDKGTTQQKEEKKYSGPSVVSYYLEGRKASKLSIPAYRCMGAGEVTVLITVDNSGTVIAAKVDESVSSTDGCLRSFAIRAARLSRFSASSTAPARQTGNIVYQFIAQ